MALHSHSWQKKALKHLIQNSNPVEVCFGEPMNAVVTNYFVQSDAGHLIDLLTNYDTMLVHQLLMPKTRADLEMLARLNSFWRQDDEIRVAVATRRKND